jgi:hypothetical protein
LRSFVRTPIWVVSANLTADELARIAVTLAWRKL